MERCLVSEAYKNLESVVKLQGWIHKVRKLGRIAFVLLRDRTGIIQCVVDTKKFDIKDLKLESVVEIKGIVKQNKEKFEIQVGDIKIISKALDESPIELNKEDMELNIDTLIDNRVISMRNKKVSSIFKIETEIAHGFSEFLVKKDFTEIYTPKIVSEGAEGGTELFKVKYFDMDAYLAQSPQFYKQMMVSAGYERVFEIGHVYRAESHDTKRHLNEYISMDLEMGFIEDEMDLIKLEIQLLNYIFENLKKRCSESIEVLKVDIPTVENVPIMALSEAISILREKYNKTELTEDIDHEGEELIGKFVKEKYNSDFVFLTHYSKEKRPMYTMPCKEKLTHSFDLIFRGMEITTGGQRINNYNMLKQNMIDKGLNPESFKNYLDIFKLGMPPHGGLAIGLERITMKLLNLDNIREAAFFVRDKKRILP
ncbi:aspartate--tRNA(Asn) ligase [Clostridium felsineum]|uniref:Aspartate--tRNA ligase n=1 Tax=Clostridium felsineum TaxID=36839 RepID=A0A1S8L6J1_9CLOT|nr:aspartate--tRNA(Asn) ligase [Clostridium felsineum]URZ02995.1 Aspartate--tRNA(Asp/Asn) ligase [Clostridium felsineum]URZ08670.1 Aspartate--tRNA(Asp/Asn) ligase [Clostridium felsineum]URZ13700.1 Aspartate--tRNA(Asp/Asn) ligase [Clostridium felsineum]